MAVRHGSDLGQMGDAEHLTAPGDHCQLFGYLLRRPAADSHIDLVKNHSVHSVLIRKHRLDRQHHAGKLAPGGYFLKRAQRLTGIHGNQKANFIKSILGGLLLLKANVKLDIQEIQVQKDCCDLLF